MFTVAVTGEPRVAHRRFETTQSVFDHLQRIGVNIDDAIAVTIAVASAHAITDVKFKHDDKEITVSR